MGRKREESERAYGVGLVCVLFLSHEQQLYHHRDSARDDVGKESERDNVEVLLCDGAVHPHHTLQAEK